MITLDAVTAKYVETREEISQLNKQIDELKILQAKREEWMLSELQKQNLLNAKTAHGTVYQTTKESVTTADWDSALNWVKENDAYEFLTKGFNKTAVLELMGEKRDQAPPPGINYVAVRAVGIRKS